MADLQIKSSTLPTRCEVCHQTDLFNQSTSFCARCSNLPKLVDSNQRVNKPIEKKITANEVDQIIDLRDELLKDFDTRVPMFTSIFGFMLSLIFLGDLSGKGLAGFIGFGMVMGLFIGAGFTAAYVIARRLKRLYYPLTDQATRERYQKWKENRELKSRS